VKTPPPTAGGGWTALALLVATGMTLAWLVWTTSLDFRLDRFLPEPSNPAEEVIADRLGDSPGSRIILVALSGAGPEVLAEASMELADRFASIDGIVRAENGSGLEALDEHALLVSHRFLLIDDPQRRTRPEAIARALEDRLGDLGMGGRQASDWVSRDPLGLLPELLLDISPASEPETYDGVWFDPDLEQALMLVTTDRPGFDVTGQESIIEAMEAEFGALDFDPSRLSMEMTGPPVFSVESARQARRDAGMLSTLAGLWVILLLALAWRRMSLVVAGALPLALAVLAGLGAVHLGFGWVHGLTLAFGFTLLGIAMDYPVHLFSHHRAGGGRQAARAVAWPLGLGALSTLVAYGAIWISASPGLAQLGAFSAAGLLVAAGITLLILPRLNLPAPAPPPTSIDRLLDGPRAAWLPGLALAAACGAGLWMGSGMWSDDLSRLGPVEPAALERDARLRGHLGAGEVGYLFVVADSDRQRVLQATEALTEDLEQAREQGLLEGWQSVDRLVPSRQTQEERRAAWPDADEMKSLLEEPARQAGFRSGAFDPFIDDLAGLDDLPLLDPESWQDTPFAGPVANLLDQRDGKWRSLVIPAGVSDPAALEAWARENPGDTEYREMREWIDLQAVSTGMVTDYRRDVLASLAVALGVIALLLLLRLGSVKALVAVLGPPLAAVAITAVGMAAIGGGLTIVQLMALILVAGIGLDYSLFLQRFGDQRAAAARTLWSIIICAASTGGVFAILSVSGIAMLSQLGATAAVGIVLALVLSWIGRKSC